MELERSLPRLQQPAIYPCPEPDKSSQALPRDFFDCKFCFTLHHTLFGWSYPEEWGGLDI